MELITKRVHTMRTKCEAVSQVTFDEDLNVPDVKPDVGRMIQKKGEIQIDEMQVSDGHVFFNTYDNCNATSKCRCYNWCY